MSYIKCIFNFLLQYSWQIQTRLLSVGFLPIWFSCFSSSCTAFTWLPQQCFPHWYKMLKLYLLFTVLQHIILLHNLPQTCPSLKVYICDCRLLLWSHIIQAKMKYFRICKPVFYIHTLIWMFVLWCRTWDIRHLLEECTNILHLFNNYIENLRCARHCESTSSPFFPQ